jgi:hypothetical protein
VLLPSITDPKTDLSNGIIGVESSALAANRWLCESLAPVLLCIVPVLSPLECALLSSIIANWTYNIASNSLWLDSRIMARKALFSTLPMLVSKAAPHLKNTIILSDYGLNEIKMIKNCDVFEKIHFYLSETVVCTINALTVQSPGLDSHAVGCLLKSMRLCELCTIDKKTNKNFEKFEKFDNDYEFLEKKDLIVMRLHVSVCLYIYT